MLKSCSIIGHDWGPEAEHPGLFSNLGEIRQECRRCGRVKSRTVRFGPEQKPCHDGKHDWQAHTDGRFLICSGCGTMKLRPREWRPEPQESAEEISGGR